MNETTVTTVKAAIAAAVATMTALWGWFGWLVIAWVLLMLADWLIGSAAALIWFPFVAFRSGVNVD